MSFLSSFFGTRNDRVLNKTNKIVDKTEQFVSRFRALSDDELRAKTKEFQDKIKQGASLDHLLPEALAVACLGAERALGLTPYRVQMIGALVLHDGKIAEMRTGEGKTLTAALASYVNALEGKGVHIVTVNDYLARRDAQNMGRMHQFLGLTVGVVGAGAPADEKRAAYACDITYATNSELGFDYLRDNMAIDPSERLQKGLHFAIVDEVDSILIDEARTPLIISGPSAEPANVYEVFDRLAKAMVRQPDEHSKGDYWADEKNRTVHLSEEGMEKAEQFLKSEGVLANDEALYAAHNIGLIYHLNAALRAHSVFRNNIEYIVRDGKVLIVDDFTGRTLPGRRWGDGLHQAIETKEGVAVEPENQTVASITLQNLFRLYKKLSGMTGTADTEAGEFMSIYNLEVVVIPTHKPMIRDDLSDMVFVSAQGKIKRVVNDLLEMHAKGRPVLVGTASVEMSEVISKALQEKSIPHNVLNAKQHEREAHIIAQAGLPGAITIATNMAGRGTDIVLGGSVEEEVAQLGPNPSPEQIQAVKDAWQERHDQVVALGGLHVMGTERHESRRIDNQLRGRAGRQGDPGSSQFYVSFDDPLMRLFAPEWAQKSLRALGMSDDDLVSANMVSRQIEKAQKAVEGHNYDLRKNLLSFDDVANDQRKAVYAWRDSMIDEEDPIFDALEMIEDTVGARLDTVIQKYNGVLEGAFWAEVKDVWQPLGLPQWDGLQEPEGDGVDAEIWRRQAIDFVRSFVTQAHERAQNDPDQLKDFNLRLRAALITAMDHHWREHLVNMDLLRRGIHLRGFAQKDPKQEYKREAFLLFEQMIQLARTDTVRLIMGVINPNGAPAAPSSASNDAPARTPSRGARPAKTKRQRDRTGFELILTRVTPAPKLWPMVITPRASVTEQEVTSRNSLCACGSGKRYKHCHGALVGLVADHSSRGLGAASSSSKTSSDPVPAKAVSAADKAKPKRWKRSV